MDARRIVSLTEAERAHLEGLLHAGTSSARLQNRARILLLTDRSEGQARPDLEVAEAALTSRSTVKRIRRRFLQEGLEAALHEKPRPGAPPKVTGDIEARLFLMACSQPPEGHARWSLRLLATRLVELELVESISHVAVLKHLKRGRSSPGMCGRGASPSPPDTSSRKWKTC
jgi:putative transposase